MTQIHTHGMMSLFYRAFKVVLSNPADIPLVRKLGYVVNKPDYVCDGVIN